MHDSELIEQVKHDYVVNGLSVRNLVDKYKIAHSVVGDWCSENAWVKERNLWLEGIEEARRKTFLKKIAESEENLLEEWNVVENLVRKKLSDSAGSMSDAVLIKVASILDIITKNKKMLLDGINRKGMMSKDAMERIVENLKAIPPQYCKVILKSLSIEPVNE